MNSVSLAAQSIGDRAVNQQRRGAGPAATAPGCANSMDPYDREVSAMCHFEELRDAEVAAILDIDKTMATLHYVKVL